MVQIPAYEALERSAPDYFYSPLGLLKSLRAQAVCWQTVLHDHLLSLPPEEALSLLQNVITDPGQRHQFLDECSPYLRTHLATAGGEKLWQMQTMVGGQLVVERDGAWWIGDSDQRICDLIRVTRLLYGRHSEDLVEGYVLVGSERHEFQARLTEVQAKGLLFVAKRLLLQQGKEIEYRRGWSRMQVSMRC